MALAMCGREAWNGWRAEHPVRNAGQGSRANFADFSNYDLTGLDVDFSGFVFGEDAVFSVCQFGRRARFERSVLDSGANFSGARFEGGLNFEGASFGDFVRFDDIEVGGPAQFEAAQFGHDCRFSNAIFSDSVSFQGAVFGVVAGFSGACFLGVLHFDGAIFGGSADFENTVFGDEVVMRATTFGGRDKFSCGAGYVSPASVDAALKRAGEPAGRKALQRGSFQRVDFSGAIFQGAVDFTGRRFLGETNFGRMQQRCTFQRTVADGLQNETIERRSTVFVHAPSFHECKLHQNTSFEGASFPVAQGREAAARAYRTLKLAFAQQQATREEQRFFRLEMAEEALMALPLRAWLTTWWQQRRR
ncbi:pentapeptide repeat-containing protein, partial [Hydrogenophaga sp.]|uniref:pentapeptide repeat-containing protein n=1 Tax=Hydrogenophaga sp. TaxID=1904254 RepID=UPI00356B438B